MNRLLAALLLIASCAGTRIPDYARTGLYTLDEKYHSQVDAENMEILEFDDNEHYDDAELRRYTYLLRHKPTGQCVYVRWYPSFRDGYNGYIGPADCGKSLIELNAKYASEHMRHELNRAQ